MTTVSSETIQLFNDNIKRIFKDNLIFAFIGGSVANNLDKPTSDIDTFIVTKKRNPRQEEEYYIFFKETHCRLNRPTDHPGFIMNLSTLYNLLSIFESYAVALPGIKQTPCVSEDCIMSQYSNAKVILWFFQDKQIILKDHPLLHAFNSIMNNYKEQVSYDKTKKYQQKPTFILPKAHSYILDKKHEYEAMVENDEVTKTPWGINTSHFFYPDEITDSTQSSLDTKYECPLVDPTYDAVAKKIISKQCIAFKLLNSPQQKNRE